MINQSAQSRESTASTGLFVLRLIVGSGIAIHGWSKIQNPTGWMGSEGLPPVVQAMVAMVEFFGGIGLLLGVLTPFWAIALLINMTGAILVAHRSDPFVSPSGGKSFELAALYLATAASLLFTGPGLFSVDGYLKRKKTELAPARQDVLSQP